MLHPMDENQLWNIRAFVYQFFAQTTQPPHVDETASHFGLTHSEVVSAYEELQRRHAVFLKPGTHDILMANPFSGVDTPFRVYANNKVL